MSIGLYDYQIESIKKMKNGCILCGGVGSGKSRTALGYYYIVNGGSFNSLDKKSRYIKMKNPMDLYIITTPHKRDTHEWDGDMIPFHISSDSDTSTYKHKVIVDSWNNIKKYITVTNAFFIFDEQRVVGSGAWVKAFLEIAKYNQWILLSATPGDTWMDYVPVFIANGFFKNRTQFQERHVVWSRVSKFPKVDRYINTGILLKYRNDILVDMNFDRPTIRHDEDVFVSYDIPTYKDIIRKRMNPYTNKPIKNASEFCQCLRRVVNSAESRQLALMEILENHDRVIIFYNYNYERDILKEIYYGNDVVIAEWNGWANEPIPTTKKWVYLVQYTAGAEGWNCTTTDTVVFYSQNYSYKVLQQAKGRIDRLNTPYRDLYYYHIRSRSGIDLAITRALKAKKKFNETKFCSQK